MLLTCKDLVKRYKEKTALDKFNLEVKEGEILGLLGPNASGKTTAINCMLSLLKFNSGEITIFGEKMTENALHIKKRIGFVPQEVSLFYAFSVYENIDYFSSLYVNDSSKRKALVEEAIEFTGLSNYKNYMAKKLSGGLLRRLNIACGIAHKPELIFMDEPTVAVDAQSRAFILQGIKELAKKGSTIIYTTHYLEEVEELCDRIVIIDNGHVIANGTLDELQNLSSKSEKIVVEFIETKDDLTEKLKQIPHVLEVTKQQKDYAISFEKSTNNLNGLISFINAQNLHYTKLYSEKPSLNDAFLELTGRSLRDKWCFYVY